MGGARALEHVVEACVARVHVLADQLQQFLAESAQQFAAIGDHMREGIQAFMHPAHQDFLRAARDGGDMQVDFATLADAVEAADALFQHVGMEGQVPEDEVLRELEVAALCADFRGDQQACALRVGEVGGVAIALQQVHVFVETRDRQAAAQAQCFFECLHLGARAA